MERERERKNVNLYTLPLAKLMMSNLHKHPKSDCGLTAKGYLYSLFKNAYIGERWEKYPEVDRQNTRREREREER